MNAESREVSLRAKEILTKALLIVGCMLIGLGVVSLAYFASPIRILLEASFGQEQLDLLIPTMGGAMLLIGIAILFTIRPKVTTDNKEPRKLWLCHGY